MSHKYGIFDSIAIRCISTNARNCKNINNDAIFFECFYMRLFMLVQPGDEQNLQQKLNRKQTEFKYKSVIY